MYYVVDKSINAVSKKLTLNNEKSSQKQKLRNIGYYHGYKGYRFIRNPNQKIQFYTFNEIIALNSFALRLKSMLYPNVMLIKALKSYVIEFILKDSHSETLEDIFNKSITSYRFLIPGSKTYKKEYTRRMNLKGKINNALVRDYNQKQKIVNHFLTMMLLFLFGQFLNH